MADTSPATLLRRAFLSTLGWGIAVGSIHLMAGIYLILSFGMPPMTWFATRSFLWEMALALSAGMLLTPLFMLKDGWRYHLGALVLLWLGMEFSVAVDPALVALWMGPTLGAALLFWLGRRQLETRPGLVYGLAGALPFVILLVPIARHAMTGGYAAEVAPDRGTPPADAPDVLVIVMDTVRAESMGAYGYGKDTSPVFDKLSKEGVLFEQATAPATWSLPAHASLFTGHFPSSHNAHGETRFLDERLKTLPEAMLDAGWETRCFTANPHISESFGLTRGFAWSDQAWITGAGGRGFTFIYRFMDTIGFVAEDKGGGQVVQNVRNWMSERPEDAPPAFVFVNFLEAHFPFHQLPEEYLYAFTDRSFDELQEAGQLAFGAQFGRQLSDAEVAELQPPLMELYDGGVLYTDALVGQIVEIWEEQGLLDDTLLVILGDHGELVGEHGAFGHVSPVYEQDLWVPMLIRYPSKIEAGSVVEPAISTTGMYATIMELLGQPEPEGVQVKSLMPALEGRPAGQPVLAERFEEHMLSARFEPGTANGKGPLLSPRGRYRTYRLDDLKMAEHIEDGPGGESAYYLFDLAADPGENDDLAAERPDDLRQLRGEVKIWQSALGLPDLDADMSAGGAAPEVNDAAMEQLRALGYVE